MKRMVGRKTLGEPSLFRLLVLGPIAVAAIASASGSAAFFYFRSDVEIVDTESQFDGVHLCSPEQQVALSATPETGTLVPASDDNNVFERDRTAEHYFSQRDPRWGDEEYDHGGRQNIGCGKSIKQCGCAMTLSSTIRIIATELGSRITPKGACPSGASKSS
jgi:hypothetical protein